MAIQPPNEKRNTGLGGKLSFPRFLVLVGLVFLGLYLFVGADRMGFWRMLFIAPMKIPHGDLQSLVAALSCLEQGIDPLVVNPCDVGGRGLLLPRTWLIFGSLGLSAQSIHVFAGLFVGQLLLSFVLLFRGVSGRDVFWAGLVCFSPAVLLGLERVNSDLLVFGCLTAAAYFLSKPERSKHWLSVALMVLATALKLYPLVGFGAYVRGKQKKDWAVAACFLAICALYLTATWSDVQAIRAVDANRHVYGVGHGMIWLHLQPLMGEQFSLELLNASWRMLEGVFLAGFAIWVLRQRTRLKVLGELFHGRPAFQRHAFVLGASCFTALFLVHSFYDYKLLLLVLTVPLLIQVKNDPLDLEARVWGQAMLWLVFLLMWTGIFFWWTVYDRSFGVDLRELPLIYYGALVIRFGLSWGLWIGLIAALAGIAFYRWDRDDTVAASEDSLT